MTVLPSSFYLRDDVVLIAKELIGKFLLFKKGNRVVGGMIEETEAYRGPEDRASHAYQNRCTKRNEVMYETGGRAYIYICYGMHALLNVVTGQKNIPHAVLLRALSIDGKKIDGPGKLTSALGITKALNGTPFDRPPLWIEERTLLIPPEDILERKRIGIDYAGEDALLPWRFTYRRKK